MLRAMPPLLIAALVVFLEIVCLGAVWPTLPRYATDFFDSTDFMVGVLFACVAGPKLFINPLWGKLSDRLGRRPTLAALCLGTAGSSALWAMAPQLGAVAGGGLLWLIVSRLMHGIFSAHSTVAFAIASDVSTPAKRTAALGVLGAAFGAGLTLGFPMGGSVATAYGLPAVGWLCFACELLAVILILITLRETRLVQATPEPVRLVALAMRPVFSLLLIVGVLTTIGLSFITPTLSLYVDDLYRFDERDAGHAFLVFGLVSIVVQGGLIRPTVKALGNRGTFVMGNAVLAAGFVVLAITPPVGAMWAALVLIGAGAGFASPALSSMFSLAAGTQEQGAVHGLNQSATAAARTLAYLAAGAAYGVSIGLPYWLGAAMLAVGLIPIFTHARLLPGAPPPPSTQSHEARKEKI